MREYLEDIEFLERLDKVPRRNQYSKLILLTFDTEQPIKEIQGNVTAGSLSCNGSSAVRRTISLTEVASIVNNRLEDLDNEIAINKKVSIEVGFDNPFKDEGKYTDDILWFPCGVYILSAASTSLGLTSWTISINGKDKMAQLDGTVGGKLPAQTAFHEREVQLEDGSRVYEHPTIYQIIYEAVNHWGGISPDKIIINDLDEEVRMLVKYNGSQTIYFDSNYSDFTYNRTDTYNISVKYGEDAGYKMTPFTYPGQLILKAGDTVVTLLDNIIKVLGNYEYFFDVQGNFVFQKIRNYVNDASPLDELDESDYLRTYNNAKYLYTLTAEDPTTQININPKWDNIKNDYYVWGQKQEPSGAKVDICYHLILDKKPECEYFTQNIYKVTDEQGNFIGYESSYEEVEPIQAIKYYTKVAPALPFSEYEYREELYRRALLAQSNPLLFQDSYYSSEMLTKWRQLYNPMNEDWNNTEHWNPDVKTSDRQNWNKLYYWLDVIDTSSPLGNYSISKIGRRTEVINNTNLNSVFNKEVPDIIFLDGYNEEEAKKAIKYFVLNSASQNLFTISSTGASCFDEIRDQLYKHTSYNTTVQVTCLPRYYLEPNNIIHIEDIKSGLSGNYQITQFNLPLTYNGTMTITASEIIIRN